MNRTTSYTSSHKHPRNRWFRASVLFTLIGMMLISTACGTPLPWQASPTPAVPTNPPSIPPTRQPVTTSREALPPAVVEATPFPSGEMPLDGEVTISFNQPMDKASVEAALQFEPGFGGSVSWKDETTLSFHPDQALMPATQVSVTVDSTARAKNGLALQEPVQLTYRTVDYLRLTQSLPAAGSVDVNPTSAVVAAFNRPMAPLGADTNSLLAPFTIEPRPEGHGEWINTSTYIFYPSPSLEGGKTYTVQLRSDLVSGDAAPLDDTVRENPAERSWSFSTAMPRVEEVQPGVDSPVALDAGFTLKFNQPMDPESVEQAFSLTGESENQIPGSFTWNEDRTEATFQPDALLPRGSRLHLVLTGEAKAYGGTRTGQETDLFYETFSDLDLESTEPAEGGILEVFNGYGSLKLQFSSPIRPDLLDGFVSISPAVPQFSTYVDETHQTAYVAGYFDPETSYTLTISPKLPDAWGRAMGETQTLAFQTGPMQPDLAIVAGTLMSGAVYLTPQDEFLEANATNIASVNVVRGSVTLPDFFRLLGPGGFNYMNSYRPGGLINWSQPVQVPPDQAETVRVGLGPEGGALQTGLYYFSVQSPELLARGDQAETPLIAVVSPVHLTFKTSAAGALVWATRLDDQKPVAGASITVYDELGNVIGQGITGDNGLLELSYEPVKDPYQLMYAVLGEPGQSDFSLAVSNWSVGIAGWDFGLLTDLAGPRVKTYLYTDRPIYQPGQTVYFKAVVRQADNGRYSLADLFHIPVEVYAAPNPNGETPLVGSFDLPLNSYGTGHASFTLPEDAAPGIYRLHPTGTPIDDLFFEVANYRKPEIDLRVTLENDQLTVGDELEAHVQADYFFGAPAGNLSVRWGLFRTPELFHIPGATVGASSLRSFTAIPMPLSPIGTLVSEGTGETGPDGAVDLNLPLPEDEGIAEGLPQQYTLEVTITDTNNQPVSSRVMGTVHPAEFYSGISPDTWTGRAGDELGFTVQTVDWDLRPVGIDDLKAQFQKVEWSERPSTIGQPGLVDLVPEFTEVGSTDFSTDERGKARLTFIPPEPGTYVLDVTGEGAHSQALIWVGGPGEAIWPNLPNQHLELTAAAASYRPGQTAEVFIPNPFGETAYGLVTVERSRVMRTEVIEVDGNGTTYRLPLTEDDAPNVYLSTTLLGRSSENRPDFRQGYLNLLVEPAAQTLNVELASTPAQSEPGGEVTLAIRVTDHKGQPVRGEFSLAVVDLAALALAEPNAPGIVQAFYRPQPLGVKTSLSLAVYASRRGLFANGQGGGGSGGETFDVREDFRDTAYWNAEVITDANGEARVSIKLPENLTTWQIETRGLTADTRVGEAVTEIVTTKDLLIRPVTPRFFVAGDRVQLAAIVHNNTQGALDAEVSLQAAGFTLEDTGQRAQQVTVPAGGQEQVRWIGVVDSVPEVDLVFSVHAGDLSDAARPEVGKLPVLRYTSPQTFATAGVLPEGGERLEVISIPPSFSPTGGELRVDLAPSLASAMLDSLAAVWPAPYGMVEPLLSGLLPNLETLRFIDQFGMDTPDLRDRLIGDIDVSITRLLRLQNQDGGWGWVNGKRSDSLITAYALTGLSRARKLGVEVDLNPILRAQEYLRATLFTPESASERWQLDRLAFIHFALQESALGDLSGAGSLYEVREQLNPWAKALLAVTLENLSPGDERVKVLISELETAAIRTATGVHWVETEPTRQNMSSPVTTTAVVVYALAQRDPASDVIPDAVRYLMAHRRTGRKWASSYETAWVLMAMAEVLKGTGEFQSDYAYYASLNGTSMADNQASGMASTSGVEVALPLAVLYQDAPNALRIGRDNGAGQLYYTASLEVYRPVETAPAIQAGMSLERFYTVQGTGCPAGDCSSIDRISLSDENDRITVRLALTVPQAMYHVSVEDYIPAGSEILNTQLETSQLGDVVVPEVDEEYDPSDPFGKGWGWWYFSGPNVYDERITWTAEYLPAGTYVLTYTLIPQQAGEYRVLPARAWETYFPEVQAATMGQVFEIKE